MGVSTCVSAQVNVEELNSEYGPNSIHLNATESINEPEKIQFYERLDKKTAAASIANIFYIKYSTPIGKVIPTENTFTVKAWSAVARVMQADWTDPNYAIKTVRVGDLDVIKSGIDRYTVTGQVLLSFNKQTHMLLDFTEVFNNKIGKPVIEQIVLKKKSLS